MKQKIIDALIERLKEDFNYGDYTVIDELLQNIPEDVLLNSLPENEMNELLTLKN